MLSRDQWNVEEYLRSGPLLYQAVGSPEEQPLRDALLALDGAIASFGRAEMLDRQASREDVLLRRGRDRKHTPESRQPEAFDRYQAAGLRGLESAAASLRDFREVIQQQGGQDPDRGELEQRLDAFDESLRLELAALELKPADAERLVAQLEEAMSSARDGDPVRVLDFAAAKIDELASVRSGADRGMVDNIPWWKVVAVAVFFGITVWALIKCVWRWFSWRCSTNEALVYALIAKAAGLGYRLC